MSERTVMKGGSPAVLAGTERKAGDAAPDVTLLDRDWKPVALGSFEGKVAIIASVVSLDTAVCDLETRHFNEAATKLGDDVVVLAVSMDLPPAQKRWCAGAGVDRVITLSDHLHGAFGREYGVLLEESRLLARAIFVVDRSGIIRYVQIVPETGKEPDYDAALKAASQLV